MTTVKEAQQALEALKEQHAAVLRNIEKLNAQRADLNNEESKLQKERTAANEERRRFMQAAVNRGAQCDLAPYAKRIDELQRREIDFGDMRQFLAGLIEEAAKRASDIQAKLDPAKKALIGLTCDAMASEIRESAGEQIKRLWALRSLLGGSYQDLLFHDLFPFRMDEHIQLHREFQALYGLD